MDSESDSYGNVYAKNPINGNSGPVCHHGFSQLDVIYIICSLNIGKGHKMCLMQIDIIKNKVFLKSNQVFKSR